MGIDKADVRLALLLDAFMPLDAYASEKGISSTTTFRKASKVRIFHRLL
jgi:hypothetical protein